LKSQLIAGDNPILQIQHVVREYGLEAHFNLFKLPPHLPAGDVEKLERLKNS
jgi:hypothetical protein